MAIFLGYEEVIAQIERAKEITTLARRFDGFLLLPRIPTEAQRLCAYAKAEALLEECGAAGGNRHEQEQRLAEVVLAYQREHQYVEGLLYRFFLNCMGSLRKRFFEMPIHAELFVERAAVQACLDEVKETALGEVFSFESAVALVRRTVKALTLLIELQGHCSCCSQRNHFAVLRSADSVMTMVA